MKSFKKRSRQQDALTKLVILSLLVAMEVVLSRFLSFSQWNIKFSAAFVPVVVAAVMFGPVAGGAVGAVSDFIGAILFPIGAYFPGFSLTAFLMGAVYGIFLYRKQSMIRTVIATLMNQFVLSLFLNSLWISVLYGSPYLGLLGTRVLQSIVMSAIAIPFTYGILLGIVPSLKKVVVSTR